MKKYLFGFGAMLVGAGLMFVLMHGEVSALDKHNLKAFGITDDEVVPIQEQHFLCRLKSISTYSSKAKDYVIMNKKYKGNPASYVQKCKIRDRKGNKTTCYMFIIVGESPAISCMKG